MVELAEELIVLEPQGLDEYDETLEAHDDNVAEQQDRCPSQTTMPGKAREEVPVPLHWIDFKQDGAASAPAQEVHNG